MIRYRMLRSLILAWAVCSSATAGGGPQNVLVVANGQSADSVAVANAYRDARGIPERNICRLDVPTETFRDRSVVPLDVYETAILRPLREFIGRHPAGDRLQFIVLCCDLPLRVNCGDRVRLLSKSDEPTRSLAALLTLPDSDKVYQKPRNPYAGRGGAFERIAKAGAATPEDRTFLVTWLRGYELRDAMDLVRRSVEADGSAPKGTFHFVSSPHVSRFPETAKWLQSRGMAAQLSDKPVRGAADVAGYFSGGSYSGLAAGDIMSNTYLPGCLVDMLESYGAVWQNWRTAGYRLQVQVGLLIRAGATGVHGATLEPLSDSFPTSGRTETMLANYLAGCNLAEAYWSAIPYLGWRNAVFGDPLCAPYAARPKVGYIPANLGDSRDVPRRVGFSIEMPEGAALGEVRCFVDGRLVDTLYQTELSPGPRGWLMGTLTLDTPVPADGYHRVRIVAVDASPAAVQGWTTADVCCGPEVRPARLTAPDGRRAAGTTVSLSVFVPPNYSPTRVELVAGDRVLGCFDGNSLKLDTSVLGPGRHTLQARAVNASGKAIALSNFVYLDLADPLHVVDYWPHGPVGSRPLLQLVYDRPLQLDAAALKSAAKFVQGGKAIDARVSLSGCTLTVEARSPLKSAVPCRLEVNLPESAGLSRDFGLDLKPQDDARLLAGMSDELPYRNTVDGISCTTKSGLTSILARPAKVVLGPVDLFSAEQPALASLAACTVSGKIIIGAKARSGGKGDVGAGLGVHYSDNRNYCFVRIRGDDVAVVQVLGGKSTTLKTWPAPGPTVGKFELEVKVEGPQLTVTLGGKQLGSVMLDRSLPPGLPMIDLGAPSGVFAANVLVRRP